MPRYRRQSRSRRAKEKHWVEGLASLAALFALGWTFSPQFRALVVWVGIIAIIIGVIALAVIITLKNSSNETRYKSGPSTLPSVNPIPPRASQASALDVPTVYDDTRYQPKDSSPHLRPETKSAPLKTFTPELLSALEWRRLEILVTLFFQKTGYEAQRSSVGADGGVDIIIRHAGESQPSGYVQCKALNSVVRVNPIREFFGVMVSDKIPHGFFVTTSDFTADAVEFARGKPLVLVNGTDLLNDLNGLPLATRCEILAEITTGDYTTPTCPQCDVKMRQKQGPTGPFWGCTNYPRCHRTLGIRREE